MNNAIHLINKVTPPNITGRGFCIAVLDTGVCPLADFTKPDNRIIDFVDFINKKKDPYDDNGHGTHVTGIACGNGYLSGGKFKGVAHESGIIGLKILDEDGHGTLSATLEAFDWLLANKNKYNIRIVNLSLGTSDSSISKVLTQRVNKLWHSGIVVVAASGNDNTKGITSPGISPYIITVGNIEEKIIYKIKNDKMKYFKPDIFAPGENIISCKSNSFSFDGKKRTYDKVVDKNYIKMSGTSMATPMVSGAIALLLQYSPNLTPNSIKNIICQSNSKTPHVNFLNIEKIFSSVI